MNIQRIVKVYSKLIKYAFETSDSFSLLVNESQLNKRFLKYDVLEYYFDMCDRLNPYLIARGDQKVFTFSREMFRRYYYRCCRETLRLLLQQKSFYDWNGYLLPADLCFHRKKNAAWFVSSTIEPSEEHLYCDPNQCTEHDVNFFENCDVEARSWHYCCDLIENHIYPKKEVAPKELPVANYERFIQHAIHTSDCFSLNVKRNRLYARDKVSFEQKQYIRIVRELENYLCDLKMLNNTEQYFFPCIPETEKILLLGTNILDWDGAEFPENLCFYRNGECWFKSNSKTKEQIVFNATEKDIEVFQSNDMDVIIN